MDKGLLEMIVNKDLTFIKTITYRSEKEAIDKSNNLKLLKQRSFQRIKIPHFAFNTFKNVLSIHMEFIKGEVLNKNNKLPFKHIIWEDLVKRPEEFSAAGYHPSNFVVNDNGLYFVDFEDFRYIEHKERMYKFKKDFLK